MTTTHLAGRSTDSGADNGALLTIKIDDEGTVFSGLVNVHRYDQPTASDIVSYVRSVLGDDPQGAPVHLVANDAILTEMIQAFGDYDVDLTCEDLSDSGEVPSPPAESAAAGTGSHPATTEWAEIGHVPVRRPAVESRRSQRFGTSGYLLVGVVGIVGIVCAGAIWFVTARGSTETEDTAEQPPQVSSPAVPSAPAPSPDVESVAPETEQPAPFEKVTLEQNGLSVELPVGFHMEPDGDMWRATGDDPDFRLQLAVDPLYGVAPDAVMRQVEKEIESDPELSLLDSDAEGIHYEHDLPDGSHAQWRTWTDRDVQLSIGCHTRHKPTTVQSATCTMANDSARFTPPE